MSVSTLKYIFFTCFFSSKGKKHCHGFYTNDKKACTVFSGVVSTDSNQNLFPFYLIKIIVLKNLEFKSPAWRCCS